MFQHTTRIVEDCARIVRGLCELLRKFMGLEKQTQELSNCWHYFGGDRVCLDQASLNKTQGMETQTQGLLEQACSTNARVCRSTGLLYLALSTLFKGEAD